jgi:hypothetical protein
MNDKQVLLLKFDRRYDKLLGIVKKGRSIAKLLLAFKVDVTGLSKEFIEYEFRCGDEICPIKDRYYIFLLFQDKQSKKLFTTLRKSTDANWTFFRSNIGKDFDVMIEDNKLSSSL